MSWTKAQIEQIPEVYRDFMLALKPVIDSRKCGAVLKITGIPHPLRTDLRVLADQL
jgi:hypothetical protein